MIIRIKVLLSFGKLFSISDCSHKAVLHCLFFCSLASLFGCIDSKEAFIPLSVRPLIAYMWSTTTAYNGNIGGVNGADSECESLAGGIAGLPNGLTHKAVIAQNGYHPRDIIHRDVPVYRPGGVLIIDGYGKFFDSSETTANEVFSGTSGGFWLGLNSSGGFGNDCANWTSSALSDFGGYALRYTTATNRFSSGNYICSNSSNNYILCLSF